MNNNETTSLNEVMGKNTTHIDLTKGETGVSTNTTGETMVRRARPVTTGPIDFNTMKDADINKILPRRPAESSKEEISIMSDLDLAVAREKEKISDRIDAILDAQDEEIENAELAAEDKELDRDLADDADSASTFDDDTRYSTHAVSYDDLKNADRISLFDDKKEDYFSSNTPNPNSYESTTTTPTTVSSKTITYDNPVPHSVVTTNPKKEEEKVIDNASSNDEVKKSNSNDDFDFIKELGLDDDDETEVDESTTSTDSDEDEDKIIEEIKTQVKEKVAPARKSIDLSKFSISKKAVSAQKIMKMAVKSHQTVADWVLYNAEKPLSVYGLSGSEILKLNPENTRRNRLNTFKDIYHIIYDHVIDANKPDFEGWLKTTNFVDLDHIYFALYMATFGNSNFVNVECPKCKKIFIKDFKIEDMIEYANDDVKEKVRKIVRHDTTSPKKGEYNVDIVQISNNYAFAIRTPSIWNVIIETASLSDKILEKYADLVDVIAYIDTIYVINEATSELIPIDYKIDPNDQAKTSARRVKAFYDVISSLSSEDYFYLRNTVSEYDKNKSDIKYIIPATRCPECSAEIPANKDITADALVFMRHQLAAIGNM